MRYWSVFIGLVVVLECSYQACGLGAAWGERIHKDDVVIMFGNIGYTDAATQPALFNLLTDNTFAIEDASDQFMLQISQQRRNGFNKLSAYPVAVHLDQLEDALQKRLGKASVPYDGTDKLASYFDRVLGILLIGSYEDHKRFSYPYTLSDGTHRETYHEYFVTSVSAMLVDLQTDEILQSTTAFGVKRLEALDKPLSAKQDIQAQFLSAYSDASIRALQRLSDLTGKSGLRALRTDSQRHMVTGAWVNGDNARALFGWAFPGPPTNMCAIPRGCDRDDRVCQQLMGLVIHGFTDVLSAAGVNTLPPLGWADWREDNAMHFSRRFMISENRETLIDRLIDISVDPKDAAVKYVPALDTVTRSSVDFARQQESVDSYVVTMSLNFAETGVGAHSCNTPNIQVWDKPAFNGMLKSERPLGSALHDRSAERFFYSLALLQALPTLWED